MGELTKEGHLIDLREHAGELSELIDALVSDLTGAKAVPLSSNVLIDREEMMGKLGQLQAALPNELKAARWMVREREAFIARTNERAREILDKARTESHRLVSESHILAEAVEEANILVRRAEGDARRIRLEAEDDLEHSLSQLETLLLDLLSAVRRARDELHTARPRPPVF